MINEDLKKHFFHLFGILLLSLAINLGSAFGDVNIRIKQPLFLQIFFATMALLYLYLYFIQKVYHYLFFASNCYLRLNRALQITVFVVLTVGVVLLTHLYILNVLLAQRNHGTIFTKVYFKRDFWFFFLPLLIYVIYLFYSPGTLLFKVSKARDFEILDEQTDEPFSELMNNTNEEQEYRLLELWQLSRVISFLFEYFQLLAQKEKWDLFADIPLWKVAVFEKTEFITFAYFINGEKWGLQYFDHKILTNPWLVKISQNCYVNMLYVSESIDRKNLVKARSEKRGVAAKEERVELVCLNIKIKTALETSINTEKLDRLLILTRRMKGNYKNFWQNTHIKMLDERRLWDTIGRIEG